LIEFSGAQLQSSRNPRTKVARWGKMILRINKKTFPRKSGVHNFMMQYIFIPTSGLL